MWVAPVLAAYNRDGKLSFPSLEGTAHQEEVMDQMDNLPEAVKAVFRVRDAVLVSYIEVLGVHMAMAIAVGFPFL